ncbi:MAG: hypothetical protein COV67_11570, partial [Nitrospinae bacterium CG11_big_fil_rev_8_21_14_0_20_56_8]
MDTPGLLRLEHQRRRLFLRGGALHLLAAVVVLASLSPALAQEQPVGKIISIIGTVEYITADEAVAQAQPGEVRPAAFEPWKKVEMHQPVFTKDRFRTSNKSRLKVLFSDNSLMALGPGTEMAVQSYRHDPENHLRQGVLEVKRGLSMYIVNKSQKHEKSFFSIVTPTANIGARGTQGYVASSDSTTLVANQAGAVATKNSDPTVKGQEVVGPMMKNIIARGQPPSLPTRLEPQELKTIQSIVRAQPVISGGRDGEKPLIEVEEKNEEMKDKNDEENQEAKQEGIEGQKDKERDSAEKSKEPRTDEKQGGDSEQATRSDDSGGEKKGDTPSKGGTRSSSSTLGTPSGVTPVSFNFDVVVLNILTETFNAGGPNTIGTAADFAGVFQPFHDSQGES